AKHLAEKLCAYFLGSAGDAWVQPTAKAYLESRGDIRAMLRPILKSSELLSSPPILKRPFDYMVSAMRALDAETDGGSALQEHLSKMGEPLYQWPMPDGYPTRTASWTGTMLPRWNFALALAGNRIGGTNVDWHALLPAPEPERLFELTHAARPEPEDRELFHRVDAELKQEEDGRQTAGFLCLASPKFQWR
ncbi:MAG: DUF1800 family protein, partial [Fimbriimonas sp.]|nr:DUF1800 family protein [Fimbriimonas sp.]